MFRNSTAGEQNNDKQTNNVGCSFHLCRLSRYCCLHYGEFAIRYVGRQRIITDASNEYLLYA